MASYNKYHEPSVYYSEKLRDCPYDSNHKMRDCKYQKHLEICPSKPQGLINSQLYQPSLPDVILEPENEIECIWDSGRPAFSTYKDGFDYTNPPTLKLFELARKNDGNLPPEYYNRMSTRARKQFNRIRLYLAKLKIRKEKKNK